jgi:haloacid dehalogenase-like hydrolase
MSKYIATLAIAYDFDGTLAPGNMQEHQFLPDTGVSPKEFWKEVGEVTRANQADKILVYMYLMLKAASAAGIPIRKQDFKNRGKAIKLFDGVEQWFDRINHYAAAKQIRIQHYLISSGNHEIFSGTKIASKFTKAYASKFLFNENGVAYWPGLAVNYTTKTQYLFRINKDAHDIADEIKVNKWVEKSERPIPFENMIFIGDGETDVPCFRLIKEQGGLSIAVYDPKKRGARKQAQDFLASGRVNSFVAANYEAESELDITVKSYIDYLHSRTKYLGQCK